MEGRVNNTISNKKVKEKMQIIIYNYKCIRVVYHHYIKIITIVHQVVKRHKTPTIRWTKSFKILLSLPMTMMMISMNTQMFLIRILCLRRCKDSRVIVEVDLTHHKNNSSIQEIKYLGTLICLMMRMVITIRAINSNQVSKIKRVNYLNN